MTRRPHFGWWPELKILKLGNFGEKLEAGEIDREGEESFGVKNRSSPATGAPKMELGGSSCV